MRNLNGALAKPAIPHKLWINNKSRGLYILQDLEKGKTQLFILIINFRTEKIALKVGIARLMFLMCLHFKLIYHHNYCFFVFYFLLLYTFTKNL